MANEDRPRVTGGSIIAGNFSFSSPDGSIEFDGGPALGQISAKVAGAGPAPSGLIVRSFLSEVLDAGDALLPEVVLLPELPGYVGIATVQPIYATGAGGIVETAATWSIGNNGGRNNWLAATPGPVTVTDPAAVARGQLSYGLFTAPEEGQILIDLGAQLFAKITVAATGTGLFALVRMLTTVSLFAEGDL